MESILDKTFQFNNFFPNVEISTIIYVLLGILTLVMGWHALLLGDGMKTRTLFIVITITFSIQNLIIYATKSFYMLKTQLASLDATDQTFIGVIKRVFLSNSPTEMALGKMWALLIANVFIIFCFIELFSMDNRMNLDKIFIDYLEAYFDFNEVFSNGISIVIKINFMICFRSLFIPETLNFFYYNIILTILILIFSAYIIYLNYKVLEAFYYDYLYNKRNTGENNEDLQEKAYNISKYFEDQTREIKERRERERNMSFQ